MSDAIKAMQIELLTMRMANGALWADYLSNLPGDPVAHTKRFAEQMANAVEISNPHPSSKRIAEIKAGVLEHIAEFWQEVEQQVILRNTTGSRN